MKICFDLLKICTFIVIFQLLSSLSVFAAGDLGRVTGRVDCLETPGCRGLAVLWRKDVVVVPDPRRFTLPPVVATPLQGDGVFVLKAPPGDYYVGAFLRKSPGPIMGPPRVGDLIFLTPNPAGEALEVTVVAEETVDVGNYTEAWTFNGLTDPTESGVSGQILDMNSKPVAGLLVFAFADVDLTSSPQGVSTRTDAEGHFILPLAKPGIVYLRARKSYQGGQPVPGDYVGVFGGAVPKALSIEEGSMIEDVRIQVLQIPDQMKRKNATGNSRPKLSN